MGNKYMYWGVVAVVAMVLWLFADYPIVGHLLIGLYVLFVFWQTISSQQVMHLALAAMGVTYISVILQNLSVSTAFSGYAFSLFVVGMAVLTKELWRHSLALSNQNQKEVPAKQGVASHMR